VAQQARLLPYTSWLGPLVFSPLGVVLLALVEQFVFRFLYGGEVSFRQSLAIVAWTSLAVAVVTLPLNVLTLYLKDDWNVDPNTALRANATLIMDKGSVPRAIYALAEQADVFAAWSLILLSMGYAAATLTSARRAAIGVVVPWAIWVLGSAALTTFF